MLFVTFLGTINEDGVYNHINQNNIMYLHVVIMISSFITDFCLPMLAFIICYMRINCVIRHRVNPSAGNDHTLSNPNTVQNKQIKKNVLRMMLRVIVAFFASFIAIQIYLILFSLEIVENSYLNIYLAIGMNGLMIISLINPFIYIAKYDEFRKCSKLMFGCK